MLRTGMGAVVCFQQVTAIPVFQYVANRNGIAGADLARHPGEREQRAIWRRILHTSILHIGRKIANDGAKNCGLLLGAENGKQKREKGKEKREKGKAKSEKRKAKSEKRKAKSERNATAYSSNNQDGDARAQSQEFESNRLTRDKKSEMENKEA